MIFGSLTLTDAAGRQERVVLDKATIRLGSAADNDVLLRDEQTISYHAELLCDRDGCLVLDLSGGAILLDGVPLAQNPQPLASGSVLTIGSTPIAVQLGPAPHSDDLLQSLLGATPLPVLPASGDDLLEALLGATPTPQPKPSTTKVPQPTSTRPTKPNRIVQQHSPTPSPSLTPPPPPATPPVEADEQPALIDIKLNLADLTLGVGETGSINVIIANHAEIIDRITVSVVGVPAEWVSFSKNSAPIWPGKRDEVVIEIKAPASSQSLAREYTVQVIAQSNERTNEKVAAELRLTIRPFTAFTASLEPARLTRWFIGIYTLTIENQGNQKRDFQLKGRDEDEQMSFRFKPPAPVPVKAGEVRLVRTRVRLSASRIIGKPQPYPFDIMVIPDNAGAQPVRLEAALVQQPPLPPWALAALLVATVVACLAFTVTQAVPLALGFFAKATATLPTQLGAVASTETVVSENTAEATAQPGAPSAAAPAPSAPPTMQQPTAAPPAVPPTATLKPTAAPTAEPGAPLVAIFDVSPRESVPGAPVTIIWQVTGAEKVEISVFGDVAPQGQQEHRPEQSMQYQLVASAPGGKKTTRITQVTIRPASATPTQMTLPSQQVITFDKLNGVPVTERIRIQGTEYGSQNVHLTFFRIELASLSLSKTAAVSTYSAVGEQISYTLVAQNNGDLSLSDVSISDPGLDLLECPAASLEPGATLTCKGIYTITEEDMTKESLVNTASASGTTSNGQTITSPQASATISRFVEPHLSLTKSVAEASYSGSGDQLHYTLVATNDGNVVLNNVSIQDPLLGPLDCMPTQPATLAPGATLTCTGTYTIPSGDDVNNPPDEVQNSAEVTGIGPGNSTVSDQASATVPRLTPRLSLSQSVEPTAYSDDIEMVTYTLEITNSGDVPLSSVSISHTLIYNNAPSPSSNPMVNW